MDIYRIDHHKLLYHPGRVAQWLNAGRDWESAKSVYPIYLELSPSGACNHRCIFCGLDYMGYKPDHLPLEIMAERLREMGALGVKSIMFAGEGEPLLYQSIHELNEAAVAAGIDTAYTTNGVLMKDRFVHETLERVAWVKVSFNAGTPQTYAHIHRTRPEDFHTVLRNLKAAVQIRRERGWTVTLGLQLLLLPENAAEVETLAHIARDDIGADYLVVKPYSQHLFSKTHAHENMDYQAYSDLQERLLALNTDRFNLVFRSRTMDRHKCEKDYRQCLTTPFFWAYVQADGSVYTCSAFLGDERFKIGNLKQDSFRAIWEGDRRRKNFQFMQNGLDLSACRNNCRMDDCNRYLWELTHPAAHVNFI